MATKRQTPVLVLAFSLLICAAAADASKFVRPPSRPLVTTLHSKADSHPQQVHISAVGTDGMAISYVTEDKTVPSLVEYGRAPGKYSHSATGESTSYKFFFYSSGKIHYVRIGPLEPTTVYYYRCGGAGDEFSFKTPPAALPLEFVVIGDLGQTEWTAATLAQVNRSDYDMLLLPGDLPYADMHQPRWDTFGRFVEPYASRRAWMVTEGNHEIETLPVVGPRPFLAYDARWRMPYGESSSSSNLYYSFDVAGGSVHVLMLGSYAEFGPSSDQRRWLEADLAKVDRSRTPWLVEMRKALEELLYRARVDIVFAGHVHAYERFKRIYDNAADPCGPLHVTIGDGGNREGLADNFQRQHKTAPLSEFREASFGHGRLRVVNGTHARWSWHRNDDSFSVLRDDVWVESLSRSSSCNPPRGPSPPSAAAAWSDEL
ncbi:unnamed protein product [Spirodela intermedia]|uniref:Purple acid phosphatase n=1 Tax=Spirodela intermedia TaxID=51605 RepID=A0A7I8JBV2_SPIIN|nr:unnamed protein product [Spirodela intermedia]CAA6667579.1 unnamed protein product [Spirodela intermedia]